MHSSQNMSEPEDENPEREIEDIAGLEEPLDSEDEASQTDELTDFETALVSGMRVAPPPSPTQLEFKNKAGAELKNKIIMYNWIALGWWSGKVRRSSGDKNELVKVDGKKLPANFIIAYDDGSEGPHCLTLDKYGQGPVREGERWVLLEPVPAS